MTDNLNIRVTLQNAAKRGLKGLRGDLGSVDKSAKKAAKGMKGLYTQLAAFAALLAGGALFGASVKIFADFDDNMRAAAAVTSATTDELKEMTKVAKEMGRTTRFTASNAAEALRFLGMAGFEATEATKALPSVMNLAAAGALDLGQAADITTNVLSAFGIEVERLADVNDVLVKTFTSSNVNLIEIGEAFKMVGPIAKGVGGDFEDLVGAIGALGNAGIKGTMAGTALKGAISALMAPTGNEAKLMKSLTERLGGVSLQIKDSSGDFIGFRKIIEQLEKAGVRGDEALKMFGERAGPGMAALINQGSAALIGLVDKLKDAGYTAEDIVEIMEGGIGGAMRKTKSKVEAFKISIGEAFGPEVIVFLEGFRKVVGDLEQTIIKMKNNGDFEGWGTAVIRVLEGITFAVRKTVQFFNILGHAGNMVLATLAGDTKSAREEMEKYGIATAEFLGFTKEDPDLLTFKIDPNAQAEAEKEVKRVFEAIGKGTQKEGVGIPLVPKVSEMALLKAELVKIRAVLDTEQAQLVADYENKEISLKEYYDKRLSIITEKLKAEKAIIQATLDDTSDVNRKEALQAKLFALDQKYQAAKINLAHESSQDQAKLDKDLLKKTEDLATLKLKAEKAFKDQESRIREDGVTTLDAEFQDELGKLQERQNKELEVIKNYHAEVLQSLRDSKASEMEIEEAHSVQKRALENQSILQQQEQEQMAANQTLRLQEYRMNNLANIAGGTAEIFGQMYSMLGKENKELFYLSKAAAIAEATMNTATAITKALPNIPMAVIAGAMGAAQIAVIASQGLAEGGAVMGSSPSPTADNIGIMATAGEFMEPVSTVKHYGADIMEGLRTKSIPKGIFAGYKTGGMVSKGRNNRFADGGQITSAIPGGNQGNNNKPEVNIINVTDPSQIDQYLSSSAGQDAILNVLGARPEAAKRALQSGV